MAGKACESCRSGAATATLWRCYCSGCWTSGRAGCVLAARRAFSLPSSLPAQLLAAFFGLTAHSMLRFINVSHTVLRRHSKRTTLTSSP